jgi:hypothetical protein
MSRLSPARTGSKGDRRPKIHLQIERDFKNGTVVITNGALGVFGFIRPRTATVIGWVAYGDQVIWGEPILAPPKPFEWGLFFESLPIRKPLTLVVEAIVGANIVRKKRRFHCMRPQFSPTVDTTYPVTNGTFGRNDTAKGTCDQSATMVTWFNNNSGSSVTTTDPPPNWTSLFSSLSTGTYTFNARGSNSGGIGMAPSVTGVAIS